MKLPNHIRLYKTDFDQEEQGLVEKLASPINPNFQVLFEALNNKLDFQNNFQASVRTVQVEVNAQGIPKSTTIFTLINSNRVNGVFVIRAENLTNTNSYVTGAPFISYTQNTDRVTINHITGLIPDNQYSITLIAV